MKTRFLAIAFAALFPALAWAQIQPSGNFTPGHAYKALNSKGTAAGDAGGANGGPPGVGLTELGITNTGLPFCINSGPTTLPYYQICMGANSLGGGLIAYEAKNGATQLPLSIDVNGTLYPFPGQSNGNVVGPTSSIINHFACWNNIVGSLLKDCGAVVSGPNSSITNDISVFADTTGQVLKDSGIATSGNNITSVGNIASSGVISTSSTATSTSPITGALTVAGGVGIGGQIHMKDNNVPNTGGALVIGADFNGGLFGPSLILAGTANALNAIIGETVNNLPPNTGAFPAGVAGYGKTLVQGNTAFGMFGLAEIYNNTGGVAVGAEFTVANFSGHAPDTSLPPDVSIGTTFTVPDDVHVTCDARSTADCSIGLWVNNTSGNYSDALFNTGIYVGHYRSSGLVIEAMPSGSQLGAVIRSNGNNSALQITSSAEPAPLDGILAVFNHNGTNVFSVFFNGEIAFPGTLSTTSATGGSATALPGAPVGYVNMWINGADRKVAYYDP